MVVDFARAGSGCRLVHLGSLGLVARAWRSLGSTGVLDFTARALEFIWRRLVGSHALEGSLGSFGVDDFTRARTVCRWLHRGSLGPLARALVVVG